MGKRDALSGEQPSTAGPDRWLRGVVPYSRPLVGVRLGLGEPSCNMAWQARGKSEGAERKGVR